MNPPWELWSDAGQAAEEGEDFFIYLFFKKKACNTAPAPRPLPPTSPAPQALFAFCFFPLQTTLSACRKQASIDRAD